MANTHMTLYDWLDDLCVRFIINLPTEELVSVERICFQIEEAQWFYEDFVRPLDPNLPSLHLRKFAQLMFQHCPLSSAYPAEYHQQAYEMFLQYKTRVPVRGAIMLNQDMTHAVLVKGWKKGAKWSFPRGKINKEEADLDCAVREVYEETGFDLKEADLVLPDEQMKKITVNMREQSMMLYVFRGVPMDAYFEPRTRKEISKIDWYKLTDLPILRRKNQVPQQHTGNDLIKESSFYMVAPFLGPLKGWIKQQHKLDRQRTRDTTHLAPPILDAAISNDEDTQAELYETSANQFVSNTQPQPEESFADIIARLGNQRPSDTLPEVSLQSQHQQQQVSDPAAELRRVLGVGMGMQSPPVEAPGAPAPMQPQMNPLLALFNQGSTQDPAPRGPPAHTPFNQLMSPPMQTQSPHGQHLPRPPHFGNMGPPPPFPFPPHPQDLPIRGLPSFVDHPQPALFAPEGIPPPFMQSPPQQIPIMQQAFDQRNQGLPLPPPGGSHFTGPHGRPMAPPAASLPAPKLSAQKLDLLNSFRTNDQKSAATFPGVHHAPHGQPQHIVQLTPSMKHPLPQKIPHDLARSQGQYMPSPPQFHSTPMAAQFQPEQPKPRTAQQDTLLTLFRNTPPLTSPEPAELSALPTTPGYTSALPNMHSHREGNPNLLDAFGHLPPKKGGTSATVSGPVNAPDFDTMKKNTLPHLSGSSRGPSPAPAAFVPQQILKRGSSNSTVRVVQPDMPVAVHSGASQQSAKAPNTTQVPFQPQILKRPQQQQSNLQATKPAPNAQKQGLLDIFKSASPQPAPALPTHPKRPAESTGGPSAADRRESVPVEQKSALLALFASKTSPAPHSPVPPARSPFPPTPKTSMSGVISPVSPLPANGSQTGSPADVASRSRISSIGDGTAPALVIPPTSNPTSVPPADDGLGSMSSSGILSSQGKNRDEARSPVDKTFLLGFLNNYGSGR